MNAPRRSERPGQNETMRKANNMVNLISHDLVEGFRQELTLCRLTAQERVVILREARSDDVVANAASLAAAGLAAEVVTLDVAAGTVAPFDSTRTGAGPGLRSLTSDSLAISVMRSADLVIDLTTEGFFHHPVLLDVLSAGTRVLFVSDPPEALLRNIGTAEDKIEATAARDLLTAGSVLRVTSAAGTDLTADLSDSNAGFQCGFVDDPGRWDHWPSVMVTCWPRTSSGVVVIQPGDVVLPFKNYLTSEIRLTIDAGVISNIDGGADAAFLRRFFDDARDPNARVLSHMGWGLMRSADWFSMAMHDRENYVGQDVRSFRGNFLLSTGPHPFIGNDTPHHLDIPMRDCTIAIDGNVVVDQGVVVSDSHDRVEDAR